MPLYQVWIWPFVPLTENSRHSQAPVGSTTLCATPAGLWSGSVASSDCRFHTSAPFWAPSRRSVLPCAESFIARKVVWLVGSGAVCLIQKRTYQVGAAAAMSVVSPAKTWLQYVPRPSISRDLAPACSCAVVIAAVPVPEQFGVTTDQRPDGVVEVWFSKPSQNTASDGHGPLLGELDGELEVRSKAIVEGDGGTARWKARSTASWTANSASRGRCTARR